MFPRFKPATTYRGAGAGKAALRSLVSGPGTRGSSRSRYCRDAASALIVASVLAASLAEGQAPSSPPAASPGASSDLLAPPVANEPVVVRARFSLRDINEIDDNAQTFEFTGVLRLSWHDPRQAFDPAEAGSSEKFLTGEFQFNETSPAWYPEINLTNASGLYETHAVVQRSLPDGTQILYLGINAVAEAELDLRLLPFDSQEMTAVFEVLGMDASEVRFEIDEPAVGPVEDVRVVQWNVSRAAIHAEERAAPELGPGQLASRLVLRLDVERQSFFLLRLVVLPLAIIVALSWTVFWMDRAAIGDRISVSFVGILTAVAYQFVIADLLPEVGYVTVLHGIVNLSFAQMCATVIVSLRIGALDASGRTDLGDRLDRRCRWMFPVAYLLMMLFLALLAWLL